MTKFPKYDRFIQEKGALEHWALDSSDGQLEQNKEDIEAYLDSRPARLDANGRFHNSENGEFITKGKAISRLEVQRLGSALIVTESAPTQPAKTEPPKQLSLFTTTPAVPTATAQTSIIPLTNGNSKITAYPENANYNDEDPDNFNYRSLRAATEPSQVAKPDGFITRNREKLQGVVAVAVSIASLLFVIGTDNREGGTSEIASGEETEVTLELPDILPEPSITAPEISIPPEITAPDITVPPEPDVTATTTPPDTTATAPDTVEPEPPIENNPPDTAPVTEPEPDTPEEEPELPPEETAPGAPVSELVIEPNTPPAEPEPETEPQPELPEIKTILDVQHGDGFQRVFSNNYGLCGDDAYRMYLFLQDDLAHLPGTYMQGNEIRISQPGVLDLTALQAKIAFYLDQIGVDIDNDDDEDDEDELPATT